MIFRLEPFMALFALFMMVVGPQTFVLFLSDRQIDAPLNDPTVQGIWLVFYLAMLPIALRSFGTVAWMWQRNLALLLVVSLTTLSFLWSADSIESLKYSGYLLGTSLLAGAFALRYSPERFNQRLAQTLLLVAVLCLVAALFFPHFGVMSGVHEGRWRGIFLHKNIMGRFMALGLFSNLLAAWLVSGRERWLYVGGALFCAGLMLMAQSASALVVTALVGATLLALRIWMPGDGSGIRRHVGFLLAVLLALFLAVLLPYFTDMIFVLTGREADLTGRTLIWQGVWNAIMDRPWAGYGSNVFWTPENGTAYSYIGAYLNWDAPHAHNGLLELALMVGLPGVVLFLMAFLLTAARVGGLRQNLPQERPLQFFILILLFTFFVNITEVTVMQANNGLWFCFLYVALRSTLITLPRVRLPSSPVR